MLAAIARYRLDSSPLTCNLDGCAPRPSSPSSEPWTPARFDEAACQGATVLERVTVPDFGGRLWWGPPLEKDDEAAMLRRSYILSVASAEFRCTSGSTNEEPSATVRSMKTASITDQQVAATAAGSSAVLLPRYVGPIRSDRSRSPGQSSCRWTTHLWRRCDCTPQIGASTSTPSAHLPCQFHGNYFRRELQPSSEPASDAPNTDRARSSNPHGVQQSRPVNVHPHLSAAPLSSACPLVEYIRLSTPVCAASRSPGTCAERCSRW